VDSEREPNPDFSRVEWRLHRLEERVIAMATTIQNIQYEKLVKYDRQIDRSATLMNRIVWALRLCALCFLVGVFL